MNVKQRNRQAGFTLVELLVVISILAVLAAIAVPALTKDDIASRYKKLERTFIADLQRMHMEAIANKDDRRLVVTGTSWRLESIDRMTSTATALAQREVPEGTWIAGISVHADAPWSPQADPASNQAWGSDADLVLTGTGSFRVAVPSGGTANASPATVYFGASSDDYKSRVVLFPATSYAKRYEGW